MQFIKSITFTFPLDEQMIINPQDTVRNALSRFLRLGEYRSFADCAFICENVDIEFHEETETSPHVASIWQYDLTRRVSTLEQTVQSLKSRIDQAHK